MTQPPVPLPPTGATCAVGHCPTCGLPVHEHPDPFGNTIQLQTGFFPAGELPAQIHRHLNRGIVYLGASRSDYGTVRIEHTEICPARPQPAHPALASLWRLLAIRYRRETGHTRTMPPERDIPRTC